MLIVNLFKLLTVFQFNSISAIFNFYLSLVVSSVHNRILGDLRFLAKTYTHLQYKVNCLVSGQCKLYKSSNCEDHNLDGNRQQDYLLHLLRPYLQTQ